VQFALSNEKLIVNLATAAADLERETTLLRLQIFPNINITSTSSCHCTSKIISIHSINVKMFPSNVGLSITTTIPNTTTMLLLLFQTVHFLSVLQGACSNPQHLRGSGTPSDGTSIYQDVHRDLWGRQFDFGSVLNQEKKSPRQYLPQKSFPMTNIDKETSASSPSSSFTVPSSWDRVVDVDRNKSEFSTGDDFGSQAKPRIVGGQNSDLAPFAMHLRWDDSDNHWKFAGCGGTLISNCHVLTAAHCVTYPRQDLTHGIYINAWRPFFNNADGTTLKPFHFSYILPELTAVNENFDNEINANDVAILTLQTCTSDMEIMEVADPVYMQNLPVQTGTTTFTSGFGQLAADDPTVPDTLQSVEMNYISSEDCATAYYPNGEIKPDMFCAAVPQGGKDACQGDSGVRIEIRSLHATES
jgi:hypothetical protein